MRKAVRPKRVPREKLKQNQQQTLMAAAISVLDQHRAKLRKGTSDEMSSAAARRAVMVLDDLLWGRAINFDEAVELLCRSRR